MILLIWANLVHILVFAIPRSLYYDWDISVAHTLRKYSNGRFDCKKTDIVYKQYLYQIPSLRGQCPRQYFSITRHEHHSDRDTFKHCTKVDLIPEHNITDKLTHSTQWF